MEDNLLRQLQMEIAVTLLPATVSTSVLVIIGLIGNILAMVFYIKTSKRTVPLMLIKYLTVADLTTCIITGPVISEMVINIRYTENVVCKLAHFMGNWTISSSCFILIIITIDRYRKICYPLCRQITASSIKYIVVATTVFALLLSVRLLATFDIVDVNVTVSNRNATLKGRYCAAKCDGRYKYICLAFYIVDFMFILTGIIMGVVMYSRILYTLLKRRTKLNKSVPNANLCRRSRKRIKISSECSFMSDEVSSSRTNLDISIDNSENRKTEVFTVTGPGRPETKVRSQETRTSFVFCSVRKPVEWNITLMMFATTVVFLICFTPYFFIRIFIRLVLNAGREYNFTAWIQFALKLPYLNSVFNPIIYSIFNVKFRRYIKRLLFKCFR